MKYFLIAGEASGDLHAAALIRELRSQDPAAQFQFLGGDLMAKEASGTPVIHYKDMAYMGFVQVAKHAGQIRRNFKAARLAMRQFNPDWVILIDYPSFNLKMAKYAKKLDIKTAYYISPKVWAWKEWRVKAIKKYIDRMLAIFPFETAFYARHNFEAKYVGNPSVEEVDRKLSQIPARDAFLQSNHLADKPLIALLPGSRLSEIDTNLPIMAQALKQFPQYRGVVAGAPGVDPELYGKYCQLPVVHGQTFELLAHARAALVTSGTATLEAALIGVPQVAMYRDCGWKFLRKLKEKFLKVKYVTLPNLILDREAIPELLLDQCTVDSTAAELARILPDRSPRQKMISDYQEMRKALGTSNAPEQAAKIILSSK